MTGVSQQALSALIWSDAGVLRGDYKQCVRDRDRSGYPLRLCMSVAPLYHRFFPEMAARSGKTQ